MTHTDYLKRSISYSGPIYRIIFRKMFGKLPLWCVLNRNLVEYLISTRQPGKTVCCVVIVMFVFCYHIYINISLPACCIFNVADDFIEYKEILVTKQ